MKLHCSFLQEITCPEVLYEDVVEVGERIVPRQDVTVGEATNNGWGLAQGTTGEELVIMKPLDEAKLRKDLGRVLSKGIKSLAVVLIHSYM